MGGCQIHFTVSARGPSTPAEPGHLPTLDVTRSPARCPGRLCISGCSEALLRVRSPPTPSLGSGFLCAFFRGLLFLRRWKGQVGLRSCPGPPSTDRVATALSAAVWVVVEPQSPASVAPCHPTAHSWPHTSMSLHPVAARLACGKPRGDPSPGLEPSVPARVEWQQRRDGPGPGLGSLPSMPARRPGHLARGAQRSVGPRCGPWAGITWMGACLLGFWADWGLAGGRLAGQRRCPPSPGCPLSFTPAQSRALRFAPLT